MPFGPLLDGRASLGGVVSIDSVSIAISLGSSVRSLERIRLLLLLDSRKDRVDRLAGEDIPLGARIIAVCDAYHAMTSDRVYQPPVDPPAALMELRRCAGTQLDPQVVAIFCEEIETGRLPDELDFGPLPSALRDPAAEPDALL